MLNGEHNIKIPFRVTYKELCKGVSAINRMRGVENGTPNALTITKSGKGYFLTLIGEKGVVWHISDWGTAKEIMYCLQGYQLCFLKDIKRRR